MRRCNYFRAAMLVTAGALSLANARFAFAAPPDVSTSDVLLLSDFVTVTGESVLRRTDEGLSVVLQTTGLEPGAYTVWWVVFNHPQNCVDPSACGSYPDDFAVGGPAGFGFTRVTGWVVGPEGEASFAGNLREGEVLMNDALELDEVLEDARTAEIQFIVRYHGPADPGNIYAQTHTLQPELGLEADKQISIHPAP